MSSYRGHLLAASVQHVDRHGLRLVACKHALELFDSLAGPERAIEQVIRGRARRFQYMDRFRRALVATVAAAFGDVVLTSDPDDFERLTRHFRGLRVLRV